VLSTLNGILSWQMASTVADFRGYHEANILRMAFDSARPLRWGVSGEVVDETDTHTEMHRRTNLSL